MLGTEPAGVDQITLPGTAGQHEALLVRAREQESEAGVEGIGGPTANELHACLIFDSSVLGAFNASSGIFRLCEFHEQLHLESDKKFQCSIEKSSSWRAAAWRAWLCGKGAVPWRASYCCVEAPAVEADASCFSAV